MKKGVSSRTAVANHEVRKVGTAVLERRVLAQDAISWPWKGMSKETEVSPTGYLRI